MGDRKEPTPPAFVHADPPVFANAAVTSEQLRNACAGAGPGLVKISDWIFIPEDGEGKNVVWAPHWGIITNAAMPIPKFASTEKWIAVAFDSEGIARVILPGCKVFAMLPCGLPARAPRAFEWFLP